MTSPLLLGDLVASERWFNVLDLQSTGGSAALSIQGSTVPNRVGAYLMDAAAEEAVSCAIRHMEGWSTFDVDLWWSNAGAGAGDCVWALDQLTVSPTGSVNSNSAGSNVTATAPVQYTNKVTTLASGVAVVASTIHRLTVRRVAADAADTLANDAAIFGVMLRRVG